MEGTHSSPKMEDLRAHQQWVKRIARHLVRGDDADDVAQDVWMQAVEHPPRQAPTVRAWLSRVVKNRVRMGAREEGRRRLRERASEVLASPPATPEEVAAALELQRLLATLVAQLPEPYRHVVYLRYVEDREPSEIAKLLGQPAGTIRWRLKEALTRLRARLDGKDPERKHAWATIALLAREGEAPAIRARANAPLLMAAGTVVLALGAFALSTRALPSPKGATTSARPGPPGGGVTRAFAVVDRNGEDEACSELGPIRDELASLKSAADAWRDPREVFKDGEVNPALTKAVTPLVEAASSSAAQGCERSVMCRGLVCEISLLIPSGLRLGDCHPKNDRSFLDRLSSGWNNVIDSGTPFHDPIAKRAYSRHQLMWRFQRTDAAVVPQGVRAPLAPLVYDFSRPLPSAPATLASACSQRWRALHGELVKLRHQLQSRVPEESITSSAPDPDLTARVVQWARVELARPTGALPFETDCRGRVCALTPGDPTDPMAINWTCHKREGFPDLCAPTPNTGDWYHALERRLGARGSIRFPMRRGATAAVEPAYLILQSQNAGRASPFQAALDFLGSFDWKGALRECEARFPGSGGLELLLSVPNVDGSEASAPRIKLDVGGSLGGSEVAACTTSAFATASASFDVPPVSNGLVIYSEIAFPLDTTKLEAKLEQIRQRAKGDEAAPRF